MLDIIALTSGRDVPSSRFRVRQYIGALQRRGVRVTELLPGIDKYADLPGPLGHGRARKYLPPLYALWALRRLAARLPGVLRSRKAGLVWLEREFQPGLTTFEGLAGKPLVFDVDDAIWLKKPAGRQLARRIARRSDVILAGNRYIADGFSACRGDLHIIPTAVDPDRFKPSDLPARSARDAFVIGWAGTHSGFPYLYAIESGLARFLATHPRARLRIVADRPPALRRLPADAVEFIPWSRATEADVLSGFSVGIMPLIDDAWARGKCAFKMLQYMAAALPVVVSPVGMAQEVLADLAGCGLAATGQAQWAEALDCLYRNDALGRAWGETGRRVVLEKYSTEIIAARLAAIFSRFAT